MSKNVQTLRTSKTKRFEGSSPPYFFKTFFYSTAATSSFSLVDYFEKYISLYKEGKISETTLESYKVTLSNLKRYFKDTKLKKISPTDYQQFLKDFQKTHTLLTTKKLNIHVRQVVKLALFEGHLQKDFTAFSTFDKDEEKEKIKFLELDDYKKLLNLTKNSTDKYEVLFYLLAKTGLRFSEATGLTKDDIDFDNLLLNVDKTWIERKSRKGFAPTKNKNSVRVVPIDDETAQILKHYIGKIETDRLFPKTVNLYANRKLRAIIDKPIKIHSLRHTYVSILISKGVDIYTISKLVGHKDTTVTLNTYAHLLKDTETKNHSLVRGILKNI
ncbi:MAG: tyrosine-type recombinase/integrase [Streptococcus sp.]|nr:tyrosine-type recombinase/integrase [Streptococcus sp.]